MKRAVVSAALACAALAFSACSAGEDPTPDGGQGSVPEDGVFGTGDDGAGVEAKDRPETNVADTGRTLPANDDDDDDATDDDDAASADDDNAGNDAADDDDVFGDDDAAPLDDDTPAGDDDVMAGGGEPTVDTDGDGKADCAPFCAGIPCGPDPVCGVECGRCGEDERCVLNHCEPDTRRCMNDADCFEPDICDANKKCGQVACAADTDCGATQTCVNGACARTACAADSECADGQLCAGLNLPDTVGACCAPHCETEFCGDDGCGNECPACAN